MSTLSRRDFMQLSGGGVITSLLTGAKDLVNIQPVAKNFDDDENGDQRLSLANLRAWEKLGYGMFIHFGMSTFDGDEFSRGDKDAAFYNPDKLDVNQWTGVARDAGMKYDTFSLTSATFSFNFFINCACTDSNGQKHSNRNSVFRLRINCF